MYYVVVIIVIIVIIITIIIVIIIIVIIIIIIIIHTPWDLFMGSIHKCDGYRTEAAHVLGWNGWNNSQHGGYQLREMSTLSITSTQPPRSPRLGNGSYG